MSPDDPRHGTYAGARKHRRDDEEMCEACAEARHRYDHNRERTRPARTRPIIECASCGEMKPHRGRNWCSSCYSRWRTTGDPRAREEFVDEVVIERHLTAAYRADLPPSNKLERVEICRRWAELGRSMNELARLAGWKPERYYTVKRQAMKEEEAA